MEKYNDLLASMVSLSDPSIINPPRYIRANDTEYLVRVPEDVDIIKVLSDTDIHGRIVNLLLESKVTGAYTEISRLTWALTITLFNAKRTQAMAKIQEFEEKYGEDTPEYNQALSLEIESGSIHRAEVLLADVLWAVAQHHPISPQYGLVTLVNRARLHFDQWVDNRESKQASNSFRKMMEDLLSGADEEENDAPPTGAKLH